MGQREVHVIEHGQELAEEALVSEDLRLLDLALMPEARSMLLVLLGANGPAGGSQQLLPLSDRRQGVLVAYPLALVALLHPLPADAHLEVELLDAADLGLQLLGDAAEVLDLLFLVLEGGDGAVPSGLEALQLCEHLEPLCVDEVLGVLVLDVLDVLVLFFLEGLCARGCRAHGGLQIQGVLRVDVDVDVDFVIALALGEFDVEGLPVFVVAFLAHSFLDGFHSCCEQVLAEVQREVLRLFLLVVAGHGSSNSPRRPNDCGQARSGQDGSTIADANRLVTASARAQPGPTSRTWESTATSPAAASSARTASSKFALEVPSLRRMQDSS